VNPGLSSDVAAAVAVQTPSISRFARRLQTAKHLYLCAVSSKYRKPIRRFVMWGLCVAANEPQLVEFLPLLPMLLLAVRYLSSSTKGAFTYIVRHSLHSPNPQNLQFVAAEVASERGVYCCRGTWECLVGVRTATT